MLKLGEHIGKTLVLCSQTSQIKNFRLLFSLGLSLTYTALLNAVTFPYKLSSMLVIVSFTKFIMTFYCC